MRNLQNVVLILSALFGLVACGPSFQFAKRPQPSALKGMQKIALTTLSYDGLMIGKKTFDEYIAGKAADKDDESAAKWTANKATWKKNVTEIITGKLKGAGIAASEVAKPADAQGGLVLLMSVEFIEPGFYVGVASRPSETHVHVTIADAAKPNEAIYDFVAMSRTSGYSTGGRVGDDLDRIAGQIAKFLIAEING